MCLVFFSLVMSGAPAGYLSGNLDNYDILTRLARPVVFGGLYILLHRPLPASATLSPGCGG
jgi:hypothetical protein